jgi:hypothetical protein
MNSNTNIAGYVFEGKYLCPTCGPKHFDVLAEVGKGNAEVLRPGLALNYVKRKCQGTNCGKTLVFQPKKWGRRLEPFAQFVNGLDF